MLVSDRLVVDIRFLPVLRRNDGVFPVKVVKYAGEQRQRSCEIYRDVHQLLDRPVQPVYERHGRRDDTDSQRSIYLSDNEISAREVDQQRSQLSEHSHHHAEELAGSLFLQVEIGDLLVDLYEVVIFLLLAGEYLYQHRAADRKRLIDLLV